MKIIKKYIVFVIGLMFFGFGISFGIKSGFGNNPMGVFVTGVASHVILSVGTCNMILGLLETGIGFLLDKKNVTLATFFVVFLGSYSIDLGNILFPNPESFVTRIIYMLLGIASYCFGFSLQQYAKCGLGNYDCFIFGIGKVLKIDDYAKIRWICDLAFIITGFFLDGIVGLGTIILVFFSGKIIVFFNGILKKLPNIIS